jgi:L-fuculose-phosphate aldolase
MTEELRREVIDTALAMNEHGINRGTSGNVSARCEDGMLITPSGMPYSELDPDDVVFVDRHGHANGRRRPSSEWRFHGDIYRCREDVGAVLHAHPTHSTALACLRRPIPAFHYMVALGGGADIRCAPYATFGTQELSDHVLEALEGRRACLMANHGLLCVGGTLRLALTLAIEVEELATAYCACLAVGEPSVLDADEMARINDKFEEYMANARSTEAAG